MNDLITAATSGLFVEIGKIIQHMEAQASRIADLERQLAEASAPAVEQKPVAYLRFRAAQQWSGVGGHDIEHNEWLETCHAHEIGDDKMPAFPVYAAPQAADTDKVREADAWMTEDGERVVTNRTMEGARRDGGAMLSSMAPYSVALVRARSMAAQAPVLEVPEPEGWREAMQEFVDRCERGEILSRYTYSKFKALLAPLPAAPVQEPKP